MAFQCLEIKHKVSCLRCKVWAFGWGSCIGVMRKLDEEICELYKIWFRTVFKEYLEVRKVWNGVLGVLVSKGSFLLTFRKDNPTSQSQPSVS